MYSLTQDLRFTLRLLRKRPGMTILVLAALVFGMGLNTAIFSVVNAVVLRPLPLFEPDRVVWLHSRVNPTGGKLGTSYADFLDWKSQSRSVESMAAMYFFSVTLSGQGPPEHLKVVGISASGFNVWGVQTTLGRNFTADDDQPGANRVVILTYAFWQSKFGGSPNILGQSLVLDDQQYTIIGVLQPTPISHLSYADAYVTNGPLLNQPHIMERDTRWFFPLARLKPGVSVAQAQAEMDTIATRLTAQYPSTNKDMGIRIESMTENLTSGNRQPLLLLILASSLIFLLAVINVMTVFLAGTLERAQELSVRLALGAPRSILLRQLLVQALMFATVGAVLGLLLAKLGLLYFLHHFANAAQRFQETNIDLRVIAVTLTMAFGTTLVASLVPAIYAFRLKVGNELRGERSSFAANKHRPLARGILILTEVAFASGLSLVAGLLIKSFYEVEKVDLGFNPHHVLSFQITPPLNHYKEPERRLALYKTAFEKLASLPAMQSVSGISSLPLTSQALVNTMDVGSESPMFGQQLLVEHESILPGFFQVMRLPLLQGRDFSDADRQGAPPVVIVDDVLAAKLWPGQSPLGKRVHLSLMIGDLVPWREVVGVVRQIKHFGPERQVKWMQIYVPQYQDPSPVLSFLANTTIADGAVKNAGEKALHELDKDLPVENFETLDSYLSKNYLSGRQVSLLLLTTFAGIGILLGLIGIYGVVANSVRQRRREIAIRMALGATPVQTAFLITRLALFATLGGILIGSIIVMSLTRVLSSLLYGVTALDPAVYATTAILLIVLALTASIVPAIRLFRLNIQEILRQ
ncbi:MAG TPA: ABC transporter permease [Candidatus Angelobacter sp.]|nr:ABC transporter permease [Candidatus Angelobacter sp.]